MIGKRRHGKRRHGKRRPLEKLDKITTIQIVATT
jgi:hypothetical protein